MSGSVTWYVDRGAGIVALALLTITVVLGILSALRVRSPRWPRFALADLHRNTGLLALAFGVVHVVSSVVDDYVDIDLADSVIPFISSYKPFWLGMGAVAADFMLAVLLTSAIRKRLGYKRWRAVHYSAYAAWATSIVHSVAIGTDARVTVVLIVFAACIGVMVGGLALRLGHAPPASVSR